MPPRPRRAPMHLDDVPAADLARVARVLSRATGDLGTLRARYPDADAAIRADEDAVGLVLVALRDTQHRREHEEREQAYLTRTADRALGETHDDEPSIAEGS